MGYEIFASKFPKLYGFFYKLTDRNYINKSNTFIFLPIIKKLSSYIDKEKPDIIIGTHPFTVDIIAYLKSKGLTIPFISVITDFNWINRLQQIKKNKKSIPNLTEISESILEVFYYMYLLILMNGNKIKKI